MIRSRVNILKLFLSIAVVFAIGFFGSFFTASSVSGWYQTLSKPVFNPPSWLFGPVWSVIYFMIGISLYLVWNSNAKRNLKRKVFFIFWVQLFLNFLWSILFFGIHLPGWAFVDIALLWFAILFNIAFAYKISKTSGWLLVPYILWVSFACVLNFAIFILN